MLFLALKHLTSRPRQTLLTLLGIIFGATAYVTISGFFLGFQGFLLEQLVNNDAHLHIGAREDFLSEHSLDQLFYHDEVAHVFWISPPSGRRHTIQVENPPLWYERLSHDKRVEAFAPQFSAQAIVRQAKSSVSATVIGCDPSRQVQVTNINDYMTQGKFADLALGSNRLVMGKGLLDKLGARINQVVQVSTGSGQLTPFKITGVFQTGIKPIDDARAFGPLRDVQRMAGTPGQINDIVVRFYNYEEALAIATTWSTLTQDKVQSWDQINASFLSVFKIQDAMRYIVIAVILIVAGFGIYNILNMTVNQKKKEIAILRSMGFDTMDIMTLFFSQGLILGIIGGLLGLIFGYMACLYLQTVPFSGGPLGGAGFLRISLKPAIYVQGLALALVSSSLASILPARAASRMTPIEIIRSGAE